MWSYLKEQAKSNMVLKKLYYSIFSIMFGHNKEKISGIGNEVSFAIGYKKRCNIYILGNRNKIVVGEECNLKNLSIVIYGDDNCVVIGKKCIFDSARIHVEDNNNSVVIGDRTTIQKNTELACIEGCELIIGQDCMLSSDISLRTGDSHSIITTDGKRINLSKNVYIGNHVWIGMRALVMKGSKILDNSIIGAGSLVTGKFSQKNIMLAGNPAKKIKENVDWKRERI